jgi:hypothetical protein
MAMRRLLVPVALLALLAPTAAWGLARSPLDGTMTVQRADDYVALNIRGAVIGRTTGFIEIVDPKDGDCSAENVWGARTPIERETPTGLTVCRYLGANIRFRLVGGRQWIRIWGPEIWVSAVGRGDVWLRSGGDSSRTMGSSASRGTYSFDSGRAFVLPLRLTQFTLGVPLPSGSSG